MNDDTRNDTTNQPVSLNNEAILDAAAFIGATPAFTSGASAGAVSGGVFIATG